jgi:hypothetical protein
MGQHHRDHRRAVNWCSVSGRPGALAPVQDARQGLRAVSPGCCLSVPPEGPRLHGMPRWLPCVGLTGRVVMQSLLLAVLDNLGRTITERQHALDAAAGQPAPAQEEGPPAGEAQGGEAVPMDATESTASPAAAEGSVADSTPAQGAEAAEAGGTEAGAPTAMEGEAHTRAAGREMEGREAAKMTPRKGGRRGCRQSV